MKRRPPAPTCWDKVPVIFDLPYASIICGLTYEHLRRLALSGKFPPAHKLGNGWRVDREEFREWLKSQ